MNLSRDFGCCLVWAIAAGLSLLGTHYPRVAIAGSISGQVSSTVIDPSNALDTGNNNGFGASSGATGSFVLPRYTGGNVLISGSFSGVTQGQVVVTDSSATSSASGSVNVATSYLVGGVTSATSTTFGISSVDEPRTYPFSSTSPSRNLDAATLQLISQGPVTGTVSQSVRVNRVSGPATVLGADLSAQTPTISYTYIDQAHANAGIGINSNSDIGKNSHSISFGALALGQVTPFIGFSIVNGAGHFPFDVSSIACVGNCTSFSLRDASTVGNLVMQDVSNRGLGTVGFNGSSVEGNYSATYTFHISDSASRTGFGKLSNIESLSLMVSAQVLSPVPEPADWAMMVSGLGFVGWAVRRRRAG